MISKKFIAFGILSLLLFLILPFVSSQEEGVNIISSSVKPETDISLYPLIVISVIGLLLLIFLVISLFRSKGKKVIMIGAFTGCLYALLPLMGAILYMGGGDPGSYWMLILPPFWPALLTFILAALLGYFILGPLGFESQLLNFAGIINVIIWAIFGLLIGRVIKTKKHKVRGGFLLVVAILTLVIGIFLKYVFLPPVSGIYAFYFSTFLALIIILFYIIRRTAK